jgi:fumarate reductase flavoprotein subunit
MADLADVVVAGGGTAGLTLALFAAQRGARVVVVERQPRIGGTLHLSSGQLSAAGTRLQAARGIHDSPQLHFEDAMRICRGTADARYLRRVIDHAAETLHWLLDCGYEVMPDHPIIYSAHEPYSIPRTCFGPRKALGILEAIRPRYEAQERAGKIRTLLETAATGVVRDAEGAVTGLRVQDAMGGVRVVEAKNVVLALGGYARDPGRFRKWTGGHALYSWAAEGSRGDGHQIGLDAGGVLRHGEKFLPTFAGVRNPQDPAHVNVITRLWPDVRAPWEVYVNLDGRRFMRENHPSVDAREHALLGQRDLSFWAIFDQGIVEAAPESFFLSLTPNDLAPLWNAHASFRKAPTIAELARRCEMDPEVLTRTVHDYNVAVARERDEAFGREHLPKLLGNTPYYAVLHHGLSVVGWAGLDTDDELRVVDAGGHPIPNLYAVGEILGFGRANGNAFIGGMGLMPALTMGRLLGQRMLRW